MNHESDPTMTHYQSALSTLIGEVLADPDLAHQDVFRWMLQGGLQDLIDAEATVKIGAAPHERTPKRTARRNGTRPKVLATPAGEVDLAIPKLREGSFFPSLLHPRRRVDKAPRRGATPSKAALPIPKRARSTLGKLSRKE